MGSGDSTPPRRTDCVFLGSALEANGKTRGERASRPLSGIALDRVNLRGAKWAGVYYRRLTGEEAMKIKSIKAGVHRLSVTVPLLKEPIARKAVFCDVETDD